MSYGRDLPETARFAPMEWLLHVNERAQGCPLGRITPHCRSTSTGPAIRKEKRGQQKSSQEYQYS
jgi:hypothetical protein